MKLDAHYRTGVSLPGRFGRAHSLSGMFNWTADVVSVQ